MLHQVQEALCAISAQGTFATSLTVDADELDIEVKGVGPLRLPISAVLARKLCAVARPAPFGLRDQTLYDTSVRDTWQLRRPLVKIDTRRWKTALQAPLSTIQRRLGLPDEGRLEAVFDKLLIYGPGQFFAPHQDSERSDDMVGTLTIELPSTYSGGAVVVEHGGRKKTFRGSKQRKKELSLLAFYADCRHEVRTVRSGYRVVLTYQLRFRHAAEPQVSAQPAASLHRLSARIREYFDQPVSASYSGSAPQQPDRLTYLLDHEYTQKSLGWERLKPGDRLRAAALRQVAEALNCEIYLALADVHETWECESEDWNRRYRPSGWGRRARWNDEDDGNEEDMNDEAASEGEDHTLLELLDSEHQLSHFIAPDGKRARGMVACPTSGEICFSRPSRELKPTKSEHEGWMGNYGNTVERWYHRAAVVMWPRERNFVIRAKMDPEWAIGVISAQIKKGMSAEAQEKARSLIPFWSRVVMREPTTAFVEKLFHVLDALADREISTALLAPFGFHSLVPQTIPAFVSIALQHGTAWAQHVFAEWTKHARFGAASSVQTLPALCKGLIATPTASGRELALWLLMREVSAFEDRHKAALRLPPARLDAGQRLREQEDLLALLDSAAVLAVPTIRDQLLASLMRPTTGWSPDRAGEFLKICRSGRAPSALRGLGIELLYRWTVDGLTRTVSNPERDASDWSIATPISCGCPLCASLSLFLRDAKRIQYAWPLAKDSRQHIHSVIDSYALPVTHETTRRGSPFTLVLTKQPALFQREAALRKKQHALLAWLQRQRSVFTGGAEGGVQLDGQQ